MLAGLGLAGGMAVDDARSSFDRRFDRAKEEVSRNARDAEAVALGLRGLFHALDEVTGDQFRAFATEGIERHAFLREAAYYPHVSAEARQHFEREHPEAGFGAGLVDRIEIVGNTIEGIRSTPRESYLPLLFRDLDSEDRMIPGLDLRARSEAAAAEAARSGKIIVTAPRLYFDGAVVADLLAATYSTNRIPAQAGDRVATFAGVVSVTVDIARLATPTSVADQGTEPMRGLAALQAVAQRLATPPSVLPALPAPEGAHGTLAALLEDGTQTDLARFGDAPGNASDLQSSEILSALDGRIVFSWGEAMAPRWSNPGPWLALLSGLCVGALILGLGEAATRLRKVNGVLEVRNTELEVVHERLRESMAEVESVNVGLERLVADRTRSLDLANREMRQVLDNLAAGVLSVDADLRVRGPLSPALERMVGSEPEGRPIREVLFGDGSAPPDALNRHLAALDLLSDGDALQWELCSDDLLDTVTAAAPGGTTFTRAIKYAPVFDASGKLDRLVIVVDDITEHLRLRQLEREARSGARDDATLLADLVDVDPTRLAPFLDDAATTVAFVRDAMGDTKAAIQSAPSECLLRLHTTKGTARALGLLDLAAAAHDVESELQARASGSVDPAATAGASALARLHALVSAYSRLAQKYILAGVESTRRRASERAALRIAQAQADNAALAPAVAAEISGEQLSVVAMFEELEPLVDKLATRLEKRARIDCDAMRTDVLVPAQIGQAIQRAMIHAVTNALDHGLEPPAERVRRGKPSCGRVSLQVVARADSIELRIADDGRGLARSISDNPDGASAAVFEPGVSTAAAVTDVSGRGVGLSAVRSELAAVGAGVRMTSAHGKGATLHIELPIDRAGYLFESGRPTLLRQARSSAA